MQINLNRLLFIGLLLLFFCIVTGTASAATLTVDITGSGDYTSIKAAVRDATNGDTIIVYPGTYTQESILVDKELTIMSQSGNPEDTIIAQAANPLVSFLTVYANNVTIDGFTLTGATRSSELILSGFYGEVEGCTINNNILSNNCCILLYLVSNNTLTNNTVENNYDFGITLSNSGNNTLTNNTLENNYCGILLSNSGNNTLTNNTLENNHWGILSDSNNNIICNNYFDNTINVGDISDRSIWNTTKTAGTNIIGGDYLGGNYWSDYVGVDTDGDGLGNTLLPYNNGITNGGDYFPLTTATVANQVPVANAGGPYNAEEGSAITFDASASSDPDGDTLQYRWDFESDGVWDTGLSADPTAFHTWDDDLTGTVTVEVNDGDLTNKSNAEVTVTNVDPVVEAGDDKTINEGDTATFSGNFIDSGSADTHTIVWDFGDVSTTSGTLTPSHTYTASGAYTVTLTVTDDDSGVGTDTLTVTVNSAPVANAGGPYVGDEGSAITFDASASFDADEDSLTYSWDLDNDGIFETDGMIVEKTWPDDYSGDVGLMVTDEHGASDISSTIVTILNVPPEIDVIVDLPTDPIVVSSTVNPTTSFSDAGILDIHEAVWNFGDGSTSAGIVTETNGAGTVTGEHTYTKAGIYRVSVTVTDDDGESATVTSDSYVVVYDPEGGFVTGGGWIDSLAGAYVADPSLAGKATFGFVSKYQKGSTVPTGNTEFQFKVADLNFKSTSYDWLVIAGAQAKYKGTGTINGVGNYGFMLSAVDGAIKGDNIDKFRIKIWDKASGEIVYDNQIGASEDAEPSTAIGGGSIVIHKVK